LLTKFQAFNKFCPILQFPACLLVLFIENHIDFFKSEIFFSKAAAEGDLSLTLKIYLHQQIQYLSEIARIVYILCRT